MSSVRFRVVPGLLILGLLVLLASHVAATPPAQNLTRIESDDPLVVTEGSWQTVSTPAASGGSYRYSSGSPDDALVLHFRGPALEILTVEHASLGILAIEIDGTVLRTVALTADETRFDVRQRFDYLDDQDHVLRVYAASGVVAIDAFIAAPALPELTGTISGVVRNAAGTATLGHVFVQVLTDSGAMDFCANADGTYTAQGLPLNQPVRITAGGVQLCGGGSTYYALEYWQETPFFNQATPITLTAANPTRTAINFTLDIGGTLSGRVTEADGVTPVEKMTVYIPELGNWACTAPDGTYTMHGIALNTAFIVGSAPGFLMWCENGPLPYLEEYWDGVHDINQATPITLTQAAPTATNINFLLDRGGRIAGRLTAAETGAPLAGVFVCVLDYEPYPDHWDCNQTGPDGTYSTNVLPIGDYRVRAYPTWTGVHRLEWFYPNATRYEDAGAVTITSFATTQNIDFALPAGAIIQGRVFAADGVTPLRGVMVSTADNQYSTCTGGQNVTFDIAVPVGAHILKASSGYCDSAVNFPTQYYNGVGDMSIATPLQITSTSQTISNITFAWAAFTTLLAPAGNIITRTPTFSWNHIDGAQWYHLQLKNSANAIVQEGWYQVGNPVTCTAGVCTLRPGVALGNTTGNSNLKWLIQPWGPTSGMGWSGPLPFSILTPTLTAPLGALNDPLGNPTYQWNALAGASWYQLLVVGPAGATLFNRWFEAAVVCSGGGCASAVDVHLSQGPHQAWLQAYSADGYGAWSGPFNFTINTPLTPPPLAKLTPTNGQALDNATVNFTWTHNSNAHSYELYLVGPNAYLNFRTWEAAAYCSGATCAINMTLPYNGTYTWYLRGVNAAGGGDWGQPNYGASTFTVTAPVPGLITKLAPINNATEHDGNVTFSWQHDTRAVAYDLYVSGPYGFLDYHLWEAATYCSGATCAVTIRVPANGAYSWYLRGKGQTGFGAWGAPPGYGVANFTVNTQVPGEVPKIAPLNGSTVAANLLTLTWQETANAEGYDIYLDGPGGYSHYQLHYVGEDVTCTAGTCSLTLVVTTNGPNYRWYMRAWSPAGFGTWGPAPGYGLRTFTVQAPAPAANPTLLAPADAAALVDNPINFRWQAVPNATWYNLVLVNRWTGTIVSQTWYSAATAGCAPGGTCSVTQTVGTGAYRWAVLTWGPGSTSVPVYQPGLTPTRVFDKLGW